MTKFLRPLAMAATLVALSAHEGVAQIGRLGGRPDRADMVERIQVRFQERLARELELDAGQRQDLADVLEAYAEARAELLPRRRALSEEVRALLEGDRSEERAAELLQELQAIRAAEADILEEEEDRLLEILRPIQVLRLQFLRDQFGEQIRRLGPPPSPGSSPGFRIFRFETSPRPFRP